MNGSKYLLDTNIILYLLSSDKIYSEFIDKELFVSFITELELLSYPLIKECERKSINLFLQKVNIIDINKEIKKETIQIRKNYKIKLPDAIICATGVCYKLPLITNDKRLNKIHKIKIISLNLFLEIEDKGGF